jgi:hypothetical protein
MPFLCFVFKNYLIDAEGLFNPNPMEYKLVTDFGNPEHVDSENIIFKIGCRSSLYQLFSKSDLKIHKMYLKLAKMTDFQTSLDNFHVFQVVEHI